MPTYSKLISVDWGLTGLTLFVKVEDSSGGTLVTRTSVGITESPASSGNYQKIITWNSEWVGKIVWDDNSGNYAQETFDSIASETNENQALLDEILANLPNAGSGAREVVVNIVDQNSDPVQSANVTFTRAGDTTSWSTNNLGTAIFGLDDGDYTLIIARPGISYIPTLRVVNGNEIFNEIVTSISPGPINLDTYISIADADQYFSNRLFTDPWDSSSNINKQKALVMATFAISRLNFRYQKTTTDQPLEFPRNGQLTIPLDIGYANAEIALALLDGVDPERELRNLRVTSRRYSSVATTYDATLAADYLLAGIPSLTAWNYLFPYLADSRSVRLHRAS